MEKSKIKQDYAEKIIGLLSKKMALDISKYDMGELVQGMLVELEHGSHNPETNVTNDDPEQTLKIVLAHLDEISDYYTRLNKMEGDAKTVETKSVEEKDEEGGDKEEKGDDESKEKDNIQESKRFRELCGIVENEEKKQLRNEFFSNAISKKKARMLNEALNMDDFNIIKFNANALGEKNSEEERDLYKMKKKDDSLNIEEL